MNSHYVDANIGLGLAFMFTWIYSAIAFVVAIILIVRRKRNNNISKEQ
jgi:flagellar biogenesis protein FliO